jgi:membrane fusion protein, multidrug efflux system
LFLQRISPPLAGSPGPSAAALVLAALVAAGCKSGDGAEPAAAPPAVKVETAAVVEGVAPRAIALTGTLKGSREADVAANASGRVLEAPIERGTEVAQGATLARLDVRSAALGASEARAHSEGAKAQVEHARAECGRARELFDQGALSRQEFERTSAQCRTSEQAEAAARARASLAAQAVVDGVVRAPFAGVVTERFVDPGEYVREDTRVATLVDDRTLRLEFAVPEARFGTLRPGVAVSFAVAAYPGRRFEGTLRYVGGAVRPGTRDVVAEALVDNAERPLRPGMFASVSLPTGEERATLVPRAALVARDDRTHVFVLGPDGRLEERVVEAGVEVGDTIAARRGVRAGERVVVRPPPGLRNGQRAAE